MKRNRWSFFLVSSGSKIYKRISLPVWFVTMAVFLLVFCSIGLINSVRFCTAYGYARICLYNEEAQNRHLRKKLDFLQKLAYNRKNDFEKFIEFEDVARLKYGMKSISKDVREAGVGGKPDIEKIIISSLESPVLQKSEKVKEYIETCIRQIDIQDSTFSRLYDYAQSRHSQWAHRPTIWPARGRITSGYGYRFHPILKRVAFHEGWDISAKEWTPVFVTADGMVVHAGWKGDYGKTVVIKHGGSSYKTLYAHLIQPGVVEGQFVRRGEVIGYVGNTGRSTGPHLHYEVRVNNIHKNPRPYILPDDVVVD